MQFVADLEPNDDGALQIMYGIDGRRDLTESTRDDLSGLRRRAPVRIGNGAFDQRQNDVFGAVLDSILLHTRRSQRLPRRLWPIVQTQAECATARLAQARPGHLGGARQAAALRVVQADVLGRARPRAPSSPRSAATRSCRRRGAPPPRRSRPTSSSTARATACCASTTTRRARRVDAARGDLRLPAGRRRAPAASVLAIARRPDRRRLRPPLPDRRDRRRPVRQGGHVPDLLVLARLRAGDRRRAAAGPRPDGAPAAHRLAARSLRGRVRRDTGRHLGNFPQAFSHLALIEAAARIIIAERLEEFLMERLRRHHRSAPAPAAARLRATSPRRASASCCWSAATGFRASRRTGSRRTCSSTTATSRRTRGTTRTARRSSPRCITSSAARPSSTGRRSTGCARGLRRAAPSRRYLAAWPISYDELEPYYTLAEQLYEVHGARGEDPTEPPASAPYPFPAVSHEPRIQQLHDDLAAAGHHPFHAPCGVMLDEAQHALQRVRALRDLRRLPVRRARQVRRRGAGCAPGARAPERDAGDERACGAARAPTVPDGR